MSGQVYTVPRARRWPWLRLPALPRVEARTRSRVAVRATILAGCGVIAYGVALFSLPCGLIVGGAALVVFGALLIDIPEREADA